MIEKMVLFENQKQLEETRDELERCKRFSFRLYAKELPLELTLSHEENNEVNAVKAILKDMEKGNWPMLHYFRMHCKSDSNPRKILQANAIGCVMMSLRYLIARNISASEFKKKIFDWDEDGEGYETYQRRVRALASKTKKVEQIKMNHTEEFPFNLVCPYQFIPTMKKNGYNDLFRAAVHPPGRMQIPADGQPQIIISLRFSLRKQVTVVVIQNILRDPLPYAHRETVHINTIRRKINASLFRNRFFS